MTIALDPTKTSAQLAADYITEVMAKVSASLASASSAPTGTAAHMIGLDKQVGRLTDHNPALADRIKKVHLGMIALGYEPRLPQPKKPKATIASYISYVDRAGRNLGNLNSAAFTFMRGEIKEDLVKKPHFVSASADRYAAVSLTSDEAVDAVLKVATDLAK